MTGKSTPTRELVLLDALCEARSMFFDSIVKYAENHITTRQGVEQYEFTDDDVDMFDSLRSVHTYRVAEFYYSVAQYGFADKKELRDYLLRHNAAMVALLTDDAKRDRIGVSGRHIVKKAIFSPDRMDKIVEHGVADGVLQLEQLTLGHLMTGVMSPETCRTVVLALARGGLLERREFFAARVIRPTQNRVLERYFEDHLKMVVERIKER